MALIQVSNLSFTYEGSSDPIFEDVSFQIDTDWKLGFIGRNGKGKSTFLKLLSGELEYSGSISTDTVFDYFPYPVQNEDLEECADSLMEKWKPGVESWKVLMELNDLHCDSEILYRPFKTLSFGERTKVMLAVLFSGGNSFLLIDEPTNHLDRNAREIIREYLSGKKGFILVSHDRDLLDAVSDHVLVLSRASIEVQAGNFSSWWENKKRADSFAISENEKHRKEINKLKASADRVGRWASKSEGTKIGFDPFKENDRNISTRSYIGAKTKKMEARVKSFEKRIDKEIEEKEGLLKDIENVSDLKLNPLTYHKARLLECRDFSLKYNDATTPVVQNLTFEIRSGERVFLQGGNGCGKSSFIKAVLLANASDRAFDDGAGDGGFVNYSVTGTLAPASGLIISYISQDTSHLRGSLKDYAEENGLDFTLLLSLLRKLDLERVQFEKNMEDYSEGQKKKVLIASSLITPAHLYIWDEPLNYIDVFSRMQIEKLIETYAPTMLIVEHDKAFADKLATKTVLL
ncbi:MAG: ATP-binding cassette domain-containing protein [Lachnospiraceae bacterium]|nr:ATP-binding cassette domain-containing protein [Lachnospiraceae bacterium]